MDLSKLKSKSFDINKLVEEAQKVSGGEKSNADERLWKPTVDKAGNGYAIIRFLPAPDSEVPWTRYWDHGFKGPTGKWYIEKSLTSIGQQDPLGELNSQLWNTGTKENQELVRSRKRRLHYVSNILVVSDPGNPENEGKVFLYQFGKKIFDKIMDLMQPQFPDEKPVNPFDLDEGADFVLKIRKVEGYRNYDKSEFRSPSVLFDGDEEQQAEVASKLYELGEFTDPANYKSYEELERKLMDVLGQAKPRTVRDEVTEEAPAPEPASQEPVQQPSVTESAEDMAEEEEDDTMSYFQKLAQAD